MKSLGVYYQLIKIPQCGYMEHGLEYVAFKVRKHMAPLAVCSGLPLVRDKLLGVPTFVRFANWLHHRQVVGFRSASDDRLAILTKKTKPWLLSG